MRSAAALFLFVLVAGGSATAVQAQEPSPAQVPAASPEQQLADRFAPILMLKQQVADCDPDGEPYRPGVVDIVLDNPEVVLRQVGGGNPVVMRAPSASDLAGLNQGFFLDFPGSSLTPECIFETDFWKYTGDLPATVYAHVVQQTDLPGVVFLQYWFYWYYNDWNNKHESDWEGITLKFEASSVEEALTSEPVAVGYSQHEGGERALWSDTKLERDGDHPFVYPSAGSHASYYSSAVFLGRGASEGFGCDTTTGPSERVVPEVIVLPDAVDDPNDTLAWLSFNGRWGERQNGAFNGPTGPAVKARWLEPDPWFEELRDSSVVIPAGESSSRSVVDVFCQVVERGSTALINVTVNPLRVFVTLLLVVGLASFVVRRTTWEHVEPRPIQRRRRAGQIVRAAIGTYRREPAIFVMFGLVYIPAAVAAGLIAMALELIPLVDSLMAVLGGSGGSGGTNLVAALLIGGFVNLLAFVVVNSTVADFMKTDEHGLASASESVKRTWHRKGDLGGAFGRSYGIVVALMLTGFGFPIVIFLLVRYQFVAQVVVLEGVDGRRALRRSGQLVRRRWIHTAFVSAILNGLVVVSAVVVGMLILITFTSVPIWVFSLLSAFVYAVMVPFIAISMTLLYGDAVAEQEGQPAAEMVSDLGVLASAT